VRSSDRISQCRRWSSISRWWRTLAERRPAESGLIVRVPQAEALVDDLRLLHTEAPGSACRRTWLPSLSPFTLPECIDGAIDARIREARYAPDIRPSSFTKMPPARWRPMQRFALAR
jgi:hypothetical protein